MSETRAAKSDRLAPGRLFAGLLLVAVGVATYAGSLDGPFIYDDSQAIEENPHIRQWSTFWKAVPDGPTEGRPVVGLSLAMNYAVGGLHNPRGYHALNIAVHILSALVLFGVVRRTLLLPKLRRRLGTAAGGIALACALLWMVHPLATESVNYVTQRTESIMALFYLLTLYCAIRAIDSPRRAGWIAGAIVACGLGMASKEVMVTAPVLVLLYDLTMLRGPVRKIIRRRWPLYVGLSATWIVLAALMIAFPHENTVGFARGVSAWEYAKNQSMLLVRYVGLVFWPHPLLIDYGEVQPVPLAHAAPPALLVLALLAATIVALCYRRPVGFLGAWFFVILAPTSSFVPVTTEVGAERRMYLPLAGLIVFVVVAIYLVLRRIVKGRPENKSSVTPTSRNTLLRCVGACLVVAIAGTLIGRTVHRHAEYRHPVALWHAAVSAVPDNPRAHNNLGVEYQHEGDLETAEACYRSALNLAPTYFEAHDNLANLLSKQGKLYDAVRHYGLALKARPSDTVYYNRGTLLLKLGRPGMAEGHFRQAIRLNPEYFQAHNNLGNMLSRQEKFDEAAVHLQRAAELRPGVAAVQYNLGRVLARLNRPAESEAAFREALRLNPDNVAAHYNLAVLLEAVGKTDQAADHLQRVLDRQPGHVGAQAALRRVRAKLAQPQEKPGP